ncbi:hypothetical protein D3C76_1183830 [compost metagenome]
MAAPAQVPDEVVDLGPYMTAHLLAHGSIAGKAAGDLAAIAAGSAPADLVGLHQRHLVAAFGHFHSRGDAGEAAADDGDIDVHLAFQRGIGGLLVEARGVVGRRTLGGGQRVFECSGHG